MEEKFTFLTLVSDPECELICQRLREAKIKYQIKNPPERKGAKINRGIRRKNKVNC